MLQDAHGDELHSAPAPIIISHTAASTQLLPGNELLLSADSLGNHLHRLQSNLQHSPAAEHCATSQHGFSPHVGLHSPHSTSSH